MIRVEVTANLRALVPLHMNLTVRGIAEGPNEVLVSEDDRRAAPSTSGEWQPWSGSC